MLTTLRIKNLALVTDLTLELQPGLNVITGETGAGKSIIIGALNLVLGERADRSLIRSGCDSCSVEAVFDVSARTAPWAGFLEENGLEPCEENQLVLKRTFTSAGANRQFINGSPTTLATLAALGQWLVDMHGPHEHQSLLYPSRQLAILDAFGGLHSMRAGFVKLARRRHALETEKAALVVDEKTYAQQLDLFRFQANEIRAAQLQLDEEPRLEQEHRRFSNAARLLELSQTARNLLHESEASLLNQAGALGRTLHELQRLDPAAASLAQTHEQATLTLRELSNDLSGYADRLQLDPARLQDLEERLNLIHSLKRKYGATLAEVLAFGEDASTKLEHLEQRDAQLTRINAELATIDADLWRAGEELSLQRRKVLPRLHKAVMKQLADLGFQQSQFDSALATLTFDAFLESTVRSSLPGLDTIEFQFAPNRGEPARPLRAIASSGEMARVMLALKTVLAAEDEIPVLVFDEVDANVGGETAHAVGEKMLQIAKQRQVLCITHLAPVAAHGTAHYVVTKEVKEERTISSITLLDRPARLTELARMLGGQGEAVRKHAEALLKQIRVWMLAGALLGGFIGPQAQAAEALPRLSRTNLLIFRANDGKVRTVHSPADWQKRREEILSGALEIMGPLPGTQKRCPLQVQVIEQVACEGYVRQRLTFASEPGARVPAYLLIPKSALTGTNRAPAVLGLHQTHAAGHKVVVGLGGSPNDEYGVELAQRGYVVLAPPYPLLADYHPDLKELGYQSGTMKAIWDNMRGLDLLEALPYVRTNGFGSIGHSLGGHNSVYTAVFDQRIKVVVSSCGLDSYVDYMDGNIKGWTSERYLPRLLAFRDRLEEIPFDFHELIGALAPRVCFISAPIGDTNFKWRSVEAIARTASAVYQLHGVPDRLMVEHPDCGHLFPRAMRERAYRILDEFLKE